MFDAFHQQKQDHICLSNYFPSEPEISVEWDMTFAHWLDSGGPPEEEPVANM